MTLHTRLIESATEAPGEFVTIAEHDPLAAVMLGIGGLLMALTFGAFGLLTVGALADLLNPSGTSSH